MNKHCARCEKTVYPIEELKCLDKIWHKTCFKCHECNMILNMKTYKGFNKLPYCNAHCPQARATTVAETPESRRLAENTKIQSNIKYHEDFEKQKGKLTQVADDPETLRIRNTSRIISNATYHGEYEKKKQMEERRTLIGAGGVEIYNNNNSKGSIYTANNNPPPPPAPQPQQQQIQYVKTPIADIVENQRNQHYSTNDNTSNNNNLNHMDLNNKNYNNSNIKYQATAGYYVPHQQHPQQLQQSHQLSPKYHMQAQHLSQKTYYNHPDNIHQQQQTQQLYNPGVNFEQNLQYSTQQSPKYHPSQQQSQQIKSMPYSHHKQLNLGLCFRAIYDYTAQDVDEVTFMDGDLIINCRPIDDGWMTGTVQRTGETGMLPSNYVESA